VKRREFMQRCAALGATVPFFAFLEACAEERGDRYSDFDVNFNGRVTIVGAGAAGLAAAYILDRYAIDFEVLEARPRIGGRVMRAPDFADFPIDLGAEWIHENPSILAELIDDRQVEGAIDVVPYTFERLSTYNNGRLRSHNWAGNYYGEYKFKSTTWFGFLENYIAAPILDRVHLRSAVTEVDYSGNQVTLLTEDGARYESDRVILTAPVAVMRAGLIGFEPALPAAKIQAFDSVTVPDGIKAFFEFSQRFYPDVVLDGGLLGATSRDHLLYDAAYLKESDRLILGVFSVGERASRYTGLADEDIAQLLLSEMDEVFDGKASRYHVKHVVQNWSAEPYSRGAYSTGFSGGASPVINQLRAPVNERLFFAGEALSKEHWATVHGAMQSGYGAVKTLLALA
jgi:monoamine oxidase